MFMPETWSEAASAPGAAGNPQVASTMLRR